MSVEYRSDSRVDTVPVTVHAAALDEITRLRAELAEARIELRVTEDALRRALCLLEVPFEDCCSESGVVIPAKVEHLATESKIRMRRRPHPADGAPRPSGHNPKG